MLRTTQLSVPLGSPAFPLRGREKPVRPPRTPLQLGALHETGSALVQKPAHVEKEVPRACPPSSSSVLSLQTTLSSPGRTLILSVLTLRQSSKGSGGHPRPTDGRTDGLVGGMLCLGENPTGSRTLAVSVSPLRLPLTSQHTGEALGPASSLRLPAVTHTKTTLGLTR